jgi:hypothetical protein
MVLILVIIAVWMLKDLVAELQSVMVFSVPSLNITAATKNTASYNCLWQQWFLHGGLFSEFVLTPDPMNPQPPAYPSAVGSLCNLRCVGQNFTPD